MADATLKIVIDAVNKGSKTLTDLKTQMAGVEGQGAKTNLVMEKMKALLGVAGVTGAAYMVGKALVGVTNSWSRYAEEVDKAAHLSGVSTEEMSRLIQAADDFRVSQESLKTSMVMALKNGFEPTIENLANLSDEYNALKTPTEKAELAAKIFGRSYAEMEPLLRQGGDAIRAGTAAIEDNLVVTEAQVAANKRLIEQQDKFQDQWTGIKNEVGQEMVPIMSRFLHLFEKPEGMNIFQWLDQAARENKANIAIKDIAIAGKDMNEMLGEATGLIPPATNAMWPLADATNSAASAMQKYSDLLLFNMASNVFGDNGKAILTLAQRMGLVDEATVTATIKIKEYSDMLLQEKLSPEAYMAAVDGMNRAIREMQSKEIDVTINNYENFFTNGQPSGSRGNVPGQSAQDRPTGGSVSAGSMYRWQEFGYRGEIMVPSQNGYILSRSDSERILSQAARGGNRSGTGDININVYGADDPQQTANLIGLNFRAAQALAGVG